MATQYTDKDYFALQSALNEAAKAQQEALARVQTRTDTTVAGNIDYFKQLTDQATSLLAPYQALAQQGSGLYLDALGLNGYARQQAAIPQATDIFNQQGINAAPLLQSIPGWAYNTAANQASNFMNSIFGGPTSGQQMANNGPTGQQQGSFVPQQQVTQQQAKPDAWSLPPTYRADKTAGTTAVNKYLELRKPADDIAAQYDALDKQIQGMPGSTSQQIDARMEQMVKLEALGADRRNAFKDANKFATDNGLYSVAGSYSNRAPTVDEYYRKIDQGMLDAATRATNPQQQGQAPQNQTTGPVTLGQQPSQGFLPQQQGQQQGQQGGLSNFINQMIGNLTNETNTRPNAGQEANDIMSKLIDPATGAVNQWMNSDVVKNVMNATVGAGTNAVQNAQAARGMLDSGQTLAELQKVGTNAAGQYIVPYAGQLANNVLSTGAGLANNRLTNYYSLLGKGVEFANNMIGQQAAMTQNLTNQYAGMGNQFLGNLQAQSNSTANTQNALQQGGLSQLLAGGQQAAQSTANIYGQLGNAAAGQNVYGNDIYGNAQMQSAGIEANRQQQFSQLQVLMDQQERATKAQDFGAMFNGGGLALSLGAMALGGL